VGFVNALQSDEHCHKVLTGRQESRRLDMQGQGVKIDTGNVPGNDGPGEDRLVIDHIDMALVKASKNQMDGETWWAKWHDIVHATGERTDEVVMFTMLDGHSGTGMVDLMQKSLHACIAWAIANDADAAKGDKEAILRVLGDTYV
jgi:hypothetical protein